MEVERVHLTDPKSEDECARSLFDALGRAGLLPSREVAVCDTEWS